MKWAHKGIIRPRLSYAALAWAYELKTKKLQRSLDKLDRMAILSFAQVKPSTPTEGLRIIYDVMPLNLHLEKCGFAAYNNREKS